MATPCAANSWDVIGTSMTLLSAASADADRQPMPTTIASMPIPFMASSHGCWLSFAKAGVDLIHQISVEMSSSQLGEVLKHGRLPLAGVRAGGGQVLDVDRPGSIAVARKHQRVCEIEPHPIQSRSKLDRMLAGPDGARKVLRVHCRPAQRAECSGDAHQLAAVAAIGCGIGGCQQVLLGGLERLVLAINRQHEFAGATIGGFHFQLPVSLLVGSSERLANRERLAKRSNGGVGLMHLAQKFAYAFEHGGGIAVPTRHRFVACDRALDETDPRLV